MGSNLYELEESKLKEEVLEHCAKQVLLQLPEGLKPEGPRLAAVIEKAGATAIVSGDPCYGACDLPLSEAEILAADLIVHYGHTEMLKSKKAAVPVVYIEARALIDIKTAVEKAIDQLKPWSRIGLATTVQHIHALDKAAEILKRAGKTVFIGNAGQVLGCDYSNAKSISEKVEAFLLVSGGRFHALGLFLATMKPTIVADPFENRAYTIEADVQKTIRRRWADINEAMKAENFGVIIGLKPGQSNMEAALKIKEDLEKTGKKCILLAMREITSAALLQFPTIEAYVNTACPRIALDESSSIAKPVLTTGEAYVALGKIRWEDLLKQGII